MLIAASCPSNRDAAVTNRSGEARRCPDTPGRSLAAVLISDPPQKDAPTWPAGVAKRQYLSVASAVAKILIQIKIWRNPADAGACRALWPASPALNR